MSPEALRIAADLVVLLHVAFVAFVMLGGLAVLRWRAMAWLHLPAVIWAAVVEFAGWICPLTPLEDALRERAGEIAYRGDFVEHYILPLLYPARLTRGLQIALGGLAIAVNLIVYWRVIRPQRTRS